MPYIEVATVVVCSIVAGYYIGLTPDEPVRNDESPRRASGRDATELP